MPTMASLSPSLGLCDDRLRLSRLMEDCAATMLRLHTWYTRLLLAGETDEEDFVISEKLEAARIRWENARQAYLLHLADHGC